MATSTATSSMRKLALVLTGIALAAGFAALRCAAEGPEWTTASPAALQAFEQGLSAEKKIYRNEAREHFARAVELDPEFAMARLKLLSLARADQQRRERMRELILETDLDALTPREQFLMRHTLALLERDTARAAALLDAFLERNPDDLYGLTIRCDGLLSAQKLDEAEQCYSRLLKLEPDLVLAQNYVGYIRMAKGDFAAAEAAFGAYERIAPDQANPHDSLGELLMLVGRYDEARESFERAVSVRSDFCVSWSHMIDLAYLRGDRAAAAGELARAERAVCPPQFFHAQRCRDALWKGVAQGPAADLAPLTTLECSSKDFDVLSLAVAHGMAIAAGDEGLATALEQGATEAAKDARTRSMPWPILAHMKGRALAARGEIGGAVASLERADAEATYAGESAGLFKLYNRVVLAALLDRSGRTADAAALRKAVDGVNPRFRARFEPVALATR